MVKIFLVEDEFYALAALKQKIIDLNENYEVVGTAANGAEALSALESIQTDILMTDIRMPDMDGITLISRIHDKALPIIPVIISGYQEFEYAKQAVRLGVQDYLLKPVDPSELGDCLKRCVKRLTEHISGKNIFSFLIGDEPLRLEFLTNCNSFTVVYLIFANGLSNYENVVHPRVRPIPCEAIIRILKENRSSKGQIFCFHGICSNEKVIILENTSPSPPFLEQEMNRAAEALSCCLQEPVTLFYTEDDGTSLSRSIQTSRKGAVRCIVPGQNTAACRVPMEHDSSVNLSEAVELFSLLLHQNQTPLLNSNVSRLFQQWKEQCRPLYRIESDLIFILNSLKQKFSSKKPYDFDSSFFVENLICFSVGYEECASNFGRLLTELFHLQPPSADLSAAQLVSRIEDYFRENFAANITLQDLADELNISKVYLCRIFKKSRNTTPIDYFTRMKINRAEEMIQQFPGLSLREISESLGFNDVYYFSKVFKKVTGVPPSEVRKM